MAALSQQLVQNEFTYTADSLPDKATSLAEAPVRVLLLDDQGHVLRVMRSIIESQGFDVVTALNEDAALLQLLNSACDVLIISGELAGHSAQHICECAAERLGENSPLVVVLEEATSTWTERYSFVRSLALPLSSKAIVGCLSANAVVTR